jgi:hypothetical protein
MVVVDKLYRSTDEDIGSGLVFPAEFFHPSKECGTNTFYCGPYRSASVKSYISKRDSPWLSSAAAVWGDRAASQEMHEMQEKAISSVRCCGIPVCDRNPWHRMHTEEKRKRQRSLQNYERHHSEKNTSYSFSPSIVERPGESIRPTGSCPATPGWETRLYADPVKGLMEGEQNGRPVTIAFKDSDENAQLIQACTFQPIAKRAAKAGGDDEPADKVFLRLYDHAVQSAKTKAANNKVPEAIAKLTFHPKILAPAAEYDGKIFDRLYEEAKRLHEHQNSSEQRLENEIFKKYTFQPMIEEFPGRDGGEFVDGKIFEKLYEDSKRLQLQQKNASKLFEREIFAKYKFKPVIEEFPGATSKYLDISYKKDEEQDWAFPNANPSGRGEFPIHLYANKQTTEEDSPRFYRIPTQKKSSAEIASLIARLSIPTHVTSKRADIEQKEQKKKRSMSFDKRSSVVMIDNSSSAAPKEFPKRMSMSMDKQISMNKRLSMSMEKRMSIVDVKRSMSMDSRATTNLDNKEFEPSRPMKKPSIVQLNAAASSWASSSSTSTGGDNTNNPSGSGNARCKSPDNEGFLEKKISFHPVEGLVRNNSERRLNSPMDPPNSNERRMTAATELPRYNSDRRTATEDDFSSQPPLARRASKKELRSALKGTRVRSASFRKRDRHCIIAEAVVHSSYRSPGKTSDGGEDDLSTYSTDLSFSLDSALSPQKRQVNFGGSSSSDSSSGPVGV